MDDPYGVNDDDTYNLMALSGLFGDCAILALLGLVVGFSVLGPTRKLGCFNLLAFTFGPHLLMVVWALFVAVVRAHGVTDTLSPTAFRVLVGTVVLLGGPIVIGLGVLGQRLIARIR
ncbi:MAG: hypothetical protein AMXMBFR33_68320 [Candidatus Xenobia bacterium]